MNVSVPKKKVTSPRWGQRHDIPESCFCNVATLQRGLIFQVATLRYFFNFATFPRGIFSTSLRS